MKILKKKFKDLKPHTATIGEIDIHIKVHTMNELEKLLERVEEFKEKYPYTKYSIEVS